MPSAACRQPPAAFGEASVSLGLSVATPNLSTVFPIIQQRPLFPSLGSHLLVAGLAVLVNRLLERKLKAAGEDLSAKAALKALGTIRLVEFEPDEGTQKRVVTRGSEQAGQVLKALKLKRSAPPSEESSGVW